VPLPHGELAFSAPGGSASAPHPLFLEAPTPMLLCFGRLAGMRAHRRRRGREPSSGAGRGRSSGAGRGHRDLEFICTSDIY
jgi:hypothetical protein